MVLILLCELGAHLPGVVAVCPRKKKSYYASFSKTNKRRRVGYRIIHPGTLGYIILCNKYKLFIKNRGTTTVSVCY